MGRRRSFEFALMRCRGGEESEDGTERNETRAFPLLTLNRFAFLALGSIKAHAYMQGGLVWVT
jgi:hypothetical protein